MSPVKAVSVMEGFSFCEAERAAGPLPPTSGPEAPNFRPAAGFSVFWGHFCFIVFFSTSKPYAFASWPHAGPILALSWAYVGSMLAHPGPSCPILAHLGPSWPHLGHLGGNNKNNNHKVTGAYLPVRFAYDHVE